jgi:hypothetical protein
MDTFSTSPLSCQYHKDPCGLVFWLVVPIYFDLSAWRTGLLQCSQSHRGSLSFFLEENCPLIVSNGHGTWKLCEPQYDS